MLKGCEIKNLDKYEYVRYCKDTIQKIYCRINGPSFKEFTSVRDYILMYLCLDNASRTGVLANITCKEFFNAHCENSSFKVAVLDHKTLAKAGPCFIAFTGDLYQEVQIFLNHFRNSLDSIDHEKKESKFFFNWSGKHMSSSMVSAQLNSFWGKAVGHTQERPRINATLVRKSAVSKVHDQEPQLKRDLVNVTCHSEDTARSSYFLREKSKIEGSTSAALRSLLREETPAEK